MRRKAFTLIELLVVVAIIALLISILLPSLKMAREQARDVVCTSNIGQVLKGFLMYANDWDGNLPGSTNDYYVRDGEEITLDWLGVGRSGRWGRAPQRGTIFPYLNKADVYRCPTHLTRQEGDTLQRMKREHRTSYTAPVGLTGAPLHLFKRVRYPETDLPGGGEIPDKDTIVKHMLTPVLIEEDTNWYLVRSYDSAWGNVDEFSDRHRGKGAIGFIDGHAGLKKFPKFPQPQIAWHMMYELTDGRFVSMGWWYNPDGGAITMGWIRTAQSDYP
jgi:prepilin-type N-terminal cleavage/methylation domain-containing protein/prepilin-type processing-associated H-X9-DG protein